MKPYRTLKRIAVLLLICLLSAGLFPISAFAEEDEYVNLPEYTGGKTTLNIYNWGQYMADGTDEYIDVIREFEKVYPDIKVNYMTFDNNETMYTKLQASATDFDLLIPSDYMIEKLIAEDKLEPLDYSNIPNFELVDDNFRNLPYDPGNIYSVPYTWGYVGIIYNGRYVDEEDVGSWDLLWNEKYAGKILMFDNSRDAFAIAELLQGYDLNTDDPVELKDAAVKLELQKPLIQSYVMDQVFDIMERSEAWIAPYYAGDYLLMIEENEDLLFNVPEEGFNFFVDACCIPKGAAHKTEAELFINFLCEPSICGPNMDYIAYSTPISAAKEYMDEELAESEILFPSEELLAKAQSFQALPLDSTQLLNDLWLEVKTSNNTLVSYLIPVLAVIVVLAGIWTVHSIRKQRLKSRRCTH